MGENSISLTTFNLHAGIDGWGRDFGLIKTMQSIDSDLSVFQEVLITKDNYRDLTAFAAKEKKEMLVVPLADAIINPLTSLSKDMGGAKSWGPGGRPGRPGNIRSLYLVKSNAHPEPLSDFYTSDHYDKSRIKDLFVMPAKKDLTPTNVGIWCLVLASRLPLKNYALYRLADLRSDKAQRCALSVTLNTGSGDLEITAAHLGHLTHGSLLQMRQLAGICGQGGLPSAILGDFNCWGPPLVTALNFLQPQEATLLRSGPLPREHKLHIIPNTSSTGTAAFDKTQQVKVRWHRAVKRKTWPAWRPHSQVDHILVNDLFHAGQTKTDVNLGSDHLPLSAELTY
jgi:endonuclease/exonuclease/phosphatase family metal-dependent hydrolase